MSLSGRICLYILIFILLSLLFNIIAGIVFTFVMFIVALIKYFIDSRNNLESEVETKKLCKHCRSEIDIEATVCPVCRRNQSNANNPIWLVPIFIIIGLFFYCLLSPNAPETAREVFCSLGIRKGYPYCYKIDTEKLDNYLNNYNFGY